MNRRTQSPVAYWQGILFLLQLFVSHTALAQTRTYNCDSQASCAEVLQQIGQLTDFSRDPRNQPSPQAPKTRLVLNQDTLLKGIATEAPMQSISLTIDGDGTFSGTAAQKPGPSGGFFTLQFNAVSGEVLLGSFVLNPDGSATTSERLLYNQFDAKPSGTVQVAPAPPSGLRRRAALGCAYHQIYGYVSVYEIGWNAVQGAAYYDVFGQSPAGVMEFKGSTTGLGGYVLTNHATAYTVRSCSEGGACSDLSPERIFMDNSLCYPGLTSDTTPDMDGDATDFSVDPKGLQVTPTDP